MIHVKFFSFVILLSCFTFFSNTAMGSPSQVSSCVACHGSNGISPAPMWPNLASQKQMYLEKQLNDFKTGVRKDPIMGPIAQGLSSEDIKIVSKFYSQLKN